MGRRRQGGQPAANAPQMKNKRSLFVNWTGA
jgi:hypothetical protein